ncbi:hypothetical protein Ac2012v2_006319 [Leucoagaricus gongylophorus]
MNSSNEYDEKLLSQAPEVSKADIQDGYNTDLLREPTVKRASTTRAVPLRSNSGSLQGQYQDLESSKATLEPEENVVKLRKPWWRTVKGIAIIAGIAIIVIIAIVIPAAVVTSRNKSSSGEQSGVSPTSDQPTPSSIDSAPGASQGSASNNSSEGADQGSAADGPVAGSAPRPV